MSNQRYNEAFTMKEPKTGKGVFPQKGESQKSQLNISVANWPGLPGKSQRDRSRGIPEEKIYAQSLGLAGGNDGDDNLTGGSNIVKNDF